VHDASIEGDYANFRDQLPDEKFFGHRSETADLSEWSK